MPCRGPQPSKALTNYGPQVEGDIVSNSESRGPEYRSDGDDQNSKGESMSRSNSHHSHKSGSQCAPRRGSPVPGERDSRVVILKCEKTRKEIKRQEKTPHET